MTIIKSYQKAGDEVFATDVSCEIQPGIGINLIGLKDTATKEVILRTVTAMQSQGFKVPGKKIVVNINPVTQNGHPELLDLPVALAIIAENDGMKVPDGIFAVGELALNGEVRRDCSVLEAIDAFREEHASGGIPVLANSLSGAVTLLKHLSGLGSRK